MAGDGGRVAGEVATDVRFFDVGGSLTKNPAASLWKNVSLVPGCAGAGLPSTESCDEERCDSSKYWWRRISDCARRRCRVSDLVGAAFLTCRAGIHSTNGAAGNDIFRCRRQYRIVQPGSRRKTLGPTFRHLRVRALSRNFRNPRKEPAEKRTRRSAHHLRGCERPDRRTPSVRRRGPERRAELA